MDSHNSPKAKMKLLQAKLEHVRQQNENLRHLVEAMNSQCNDLLARIHEANRTYSSSDHHHFNNNINIGGVTAQVPPVPNAKQSRIFVKADSKDSSLIVKDGHQWRKYGQKVTKDNPSPRAYFRCSMASSGCPVKKKVQRCMEDKSFLVATYEGEHNHDVQCSSLGQSSSLANYCSPKSSIAHCPDYQTTDSFGSDVTLDLTLSGSNQETRPPRNLMQVGDDTKKIEEYVASLTKDPSFTLALADAVASSINGLHRPM